MNSTRTPCCTANQVAAAGMLALAVAMGIGRFAFTPLLPMMQDDYALAVSDGALLATANYCGYLLGALSAMATAVHPATAITGGLWVIGLATFGMGISEGFMTWLLLRAIAGIASAWIMIYVTSWCLQQLSMMNKAGLNGRIFGGVGLGIMIAGLLSLAMMHFHLSAAATWIALGACSLLVALAVGRVIARGAHTAAASAPARAHTQWNSESLRIVFAYASSGYGYIMPATFLPVMAKEVIRDAAVFGWSWPLFGVAATLSTLAAAALRRRFDNRHIWIAAQLAMAAGVALPALWHDFTAVILSALMVGGSFMVITMSALQEAKSIAGPHAIGLIGALTAAFALGQIIGPLSVNVLIHAGGGIKAALLIASVVLAGGALVLFRTPRSIVAAPARDVI